MTVTSPPTTTTAGMLDFQRITRRFARAADPILDNLDLHIGEGEFVSLIGPSGCGKTTLLRIGAGLLAPTAGDVYVDGRSSLGPSPDKAVVFQHFNLFPWRTALDNVAYGLEMQRVGKKERLERAARYLSLMGLAGYERHLPAELSGGMRQRVGIARALAIEPKVVLMDEPFGALDALTREHLQVELERLGAERRLTVLFVTHSIDEALYLSDRVVVMSRSPGRIVRQFEVPFRRPRSTYDVRSEPRFAEFRNQIWDLLQDQLDLPIPAGGGRTGS